MTINDLNLMSQVVLSLRRVVGLQDAYPVLGAEGSDFFVEICSGCMRFRSIHKIVHIAFDGGPVGDCSELKVNDTEVMVSLPDASYLIAFLGLMEAALGRPTKVLHPLDASGDFLPGWDDALEFIASGMQA